MMRVLDLFSGAGGMSLGFEAAGAVPVGAVEWDAAAAATWKRMFGASGARIFGGPEEGDVNRIPVHDLIAALPARPDVVVGGPPCQGFSQIGRAKLRSLLDSEAQIELGVRNPERNELYRYFLAAVSVARPLAFVMENVPGMRGLLGVDHAGRIAREAASLGYNVRYFLLNAADFGVPQHRWRLFFVGLRSDLGVHALPRPPVRTHRGAGSLPEATSIPDDPWMTEDVPIAPDARGPVTAWEALDDLPRLRKHLDGVRDIPAVGTYRAIHSDYAAVMRAWAGHLPQDSVEDHWFRSTPRDFPIFAEMAEDDRYPEALQIAHRRLSAALAARRRAGLQVDEAEMAALQKEYIPPYRNDAFSDKWRKLSMDEPSWTVTAHLSKDSYSHIHYDSSQARTITVREAARLQSFPDSFRFTGSFGARFRQVGNAVPPLLARALCLNLFQQLRELGVDFDKRQAA